MKEVASVKPISKELFLGRMMAWCYRWGCEVELKNLAYNYPVMDPLKDYWAVGEYHEKDRDGSLVDMAHRTKHKVIEIPVLVFKRGSRRISIQGNDWEDLMRCFEYSHKKIYMELSVPMMSFNE